MATFNGDRFLRAQLDSLARQTSLPHELVVTDDGSVDRTLEILAEFQKTAPFPVRVSPNPSRLGYADNFVRAASLCGGELIAFSDQDDVWKPGKLEQCSAAFDSQSVQLVAHATNEVDSDLHWLGYSPHIRKPLRILQGKESRMLPWCIGCAVVVRRGVMEEMLLRWPNNHVQQITKVGSTLVGHDDTAFFVANGLGEIRFIPDRLIDHRVHGRNTTNSLPRISDKLNYSSAVGFSAYKRQAHYLETRAETLLQMSQVDGHPGVCSVLRRTSATLVSAANCARARANIYEQQGRLRRTMLVLDAGIRGLYRRHLGMHGFRSAMKDLVIALIPGAAATETEVK